MASTAKTWFECMLECIYTDNVTAKDIKEKSTYLIDAMTFTEAEARMTEKIKELPGGEYVIKKLNPMKLDDFYDDGDYERWWKVKVVMEIEQDNGKRKKIPFFSVIHADTAEDAAKMIKEKYSETVNDFAIKEVKEYILNDYIKKIGE